MLEGVFRDIGHLSVYEPEGAAIPFRLIWDAVQSEGGFTMGRSVYSDAGRSGFAEVRALPSPASGAVINVGGALMTIVGDPVHPDDDPERLLWHLILADAA